LIGKTLAHYEIIDLLGKGGMGEVYRARDTRLAREVAVKVLPAALSANSDLRARLEREARTISSLNHPHICVLHDVGREGDIDFLVMEYIEGQTLADRIEEKGPLPPGETLKIGAQIADALDQAHRAGVIHRDLKPGNVMLTRTGAKLMDFGLARVADLKTPEGQSGVTIAQLSQSPTFAQPLTAEGAIVGTFQYMSPEQLEGKNVDERSDLWALGCVLYEMATGRRSFDGSSQASLIAAIMHTDPTPVSQLSTLSPPAFDRIVQACLVKDPAERVQSAHDLRLQLEWMAESDGSSSMGLAPVPIAPAARNAWRPYLVGAVLAAVVTAIVMAVLLAPRGAQEAADAPQRYVVGDFDLRASTTPLISADGVYLVLTVSEGATQRLYRRDLRSLETTPIQGSEGASAPFFSPDGAWIGFCASEAIKKVPVSGGVAQQIVSVSRPTAADWAPDGWIYYTVRSGGSDGSTAVVRVRETGGNPEAVAELDRDAGENEAWLPEVLPNGETVLFNTLGSDMRVVASRSDGSREVLLENAFLARYAEPGYLLYRDATSEAVLVVEFDPVSLTLKGSPLAITEPVDPNFCYDISEEGKLVYVPTPGAGQGVNLAWVDRDGTITRAADLLADWASPRISPDGKQVVVRKAMTMCEVWILDVDRGRLHRVAQENDNHNAIWSPDGRAIAYSRSNDQQVVTMNVNGPPRPTVLLEREDYGVPRSWSSNLFAYTRRGEGTLADIWILEMDGGSSPKPYLAGVFDEDFPDISPDGKWIAYASDEPGAMEILLRRYPDDGNFWQVSSEGGNYPTWSTAGDVIYYMHGSTMMEVPITTEPSVVIGTPEPVFDGAIRSSRPHDYDVGPDGRFISVDYGTDGGDYKELRILVNWPAEMARLSGSGARR